MWKGGVTGAVVIFGARRMFVRARVMRVRFSNSREVVGRSESRLCLADFTTSLCAVPPPPASMASRSALIEEGVVESVHAKLIADRAPPQIGLIVGKREVGARDFILALVPCPDWNAEDGDGDGDRAQTGGGTPRAQRPAGGGAPLHIDGDSIFEHTTQVTRMLPGGLDVVGAYAFASEQAWRSSSGALARAVLEAAEAEALEPDTPAESQSVSEKEAKGVEQFLLYLSAEDMRKTSLRRVKRSTLAQPFALLPPAESRQGKALASLVRLETEYEAEVRVVVPATRATRNGTAKDRTLRALLETALRHETARVMASVTLVEDALWDDDVAVSAVPRARRGSETLFPLPDEDRGEDDGKRAKTRDVFALRAELLPPPRSASFARALDPAPEPSDATDDASRTARATLTFGGVVSARAYAFARGAIGDAAADLRRDVARSLRSRMDAFLDEADDALEDDTRDLGGNALASVERSLIASPSLRVADALRDARRGGDARPGELRCALPRRAWAEWRGGIAVCDYLADGETEADVVARCLEVMRFDVVGGARGVVLAEAEHRRARGESGGGSVAAKRETRAAGDAEKNASTSAPPSTASGKKPSSSYAAYALGAGVALVSAGLANLVTKSPDIAACVGELCARAAEAAERAPY